MTQATSTMSKGPFACPHRDSRQRPKWPNPRRRHAKRRDYLHGQGVPTVADGKTLPLRVVHRDPAQPLLLPRVRVQRRRVVGRTALPRPRPRRRCGPAQPPLVGQRQGRFHLQRRGWCERRPMRSCRRIRCLVSSMKYTVVVVGPHAGDVKAKASGRVLASRADANHFNSARISFSLCRSIDLSIYK